MSEVVVPPSWALLSVDEYGIDIRESASCAGYAGYRVKHQHEYPELLLHDIDEAQRRDVAEVVFAGEPFPCGSGFLETAEFGESKGMTQRRRDAAGIGV